MIPLFVQASNDHKNEEQPTTNTIPDSTLKINPDAQFLLAKPHSISVITACLHSQQAINFTRQILLQLQPEFFDPKIATPSNQILISNKLQIGYISHTEPFHWAYFEISNLSNQRILNMMACVSSTLIYEEKNPEIDRICLNEAINKFKQISNKIPNIVYLRTSDRSENTISQTFTSNFHEILLPTLQSLNSPQLSLAQSMIQNGRKILNESFVLQDRKGIVSCSLLLSFFKKWDQEISYEQMESGRSIWDFAMSQFECGLKQKCIQQYRLRMSKLYEDKKFVSLKLLRNSHDIALEIAMKSIEKYKIIQDHFMQEIEALIKDELNSIVEQIGSINLKWGQNFIKNEFEQIESRLKNKQLKLITSLKNQFTIFMQYFHKKTQNLCCKKLDSYFQQFIVEKAFECSNVISQSEKKSVLADLQQGKNKINKYENQIKDLRKSISKENNQYINTTAHLQQQVSYYKNRQEMLEATINQLKLERVQIDQQHTQKQFSIQQSYLDELNWHKQQNTILRDRSEQLSHKIELLTSEIEKQKEMHQQTNRHYKQIIGEYKNKESLLKDHISDMTVKNNIQMESVKRDSMRELNQSNIEMNEKQKEGAILIEQLNLMNQKYFELEKFSTNLQYQMQVKKAEEDTWRADLEIALKISEEKVYEYESRFPRYQRLQQDLQNYERTIEQSRSERKQIQKQTALLKQQNKFISDKFRQMELKYEGQKITSQQLKNSLDEMQDKIIKYNTVKVNEWVQTEPDFKLKLQLEEALGLVSVLQNQYKKVKLENSRLRYKAQ